MRNKRYKPVEIPNDSSIGAGVPSIAAKPKETKFLDGEEANIESILNIPILFTDWIILPSKWKEDSEFLKIQFVATDGLRTVSTGSTYLIDQIRKQEQLIPAGGDKRFKAIIRKTSHGAFIFEAVK